MQTLRRFLWVGLALAAVGGSFWVYHRAVVSPGPPRAERRLSVVTSFYPLYFATKELAGELADVSVITPAGAEPHDYEPTFQDMGLIEEAHMLVVHGTLEPWASKILERSLSQGLVVVEVGQGAGAGNDPHVWLSPIRMQSIVRSIASGLVSLDPSHSDTYRAREAVLIQKLQQLDAEYRTGLSQCARHELVTSHAAFGHLAEEYGLMQVPIAGISPDAEPSPQDLVSVVNFARAHQVTTVFFESLVSPKLSDTIAQTIGAKTAILNPLEGLTQAEQLSGKEYFSVMKENLQQLRTALDCR